MKSQQHFDPNQSKQWWLVVVQTNESNYKQTEKIKLILEWRCVFLIVSDASSILNFIFIFKLIVCRLDVPFLVVSMHLHYNTILPKTIKDVLKLINGYRHCIGYCNTSFQTNLKKFYFLVFDSFSLSFKFLIKVW